MEYKGIEGIGDTVLYEGDCLEIMPKYVADKSVDVILCDLPYGTTKCKWDVIIPFDLLWKEYKRVLRKGGVVLLFGQTPFDKVLGCSNIEWLKYEWVWEKTSATGHLNAKKMPMKAHENILVFYEKSHKYYPQKTDGHIRKVSKAEHKVNCIESDVYNKGQKLTSYDSTERYPRSVQVFASDKQKTKLDGTIHPTQKPLALIEYIIKTYSKVGDVILDNTTGSGTTNVACIKLGRKSIGIEKDAKWFGVATDRCKKMYKEVNQSLFPEK